MNRWSEFFGLSDLWSVFAVCFFFRHKPPLFTDGGKSGLCSEKGYGLCVHQPDFKAHHTLWFLLFSYKDVTFNSFFFWLCTAKEPHNPGKNHRCSLVHYHPECTCLYFALWNVNLLRFISFSLTFCVHATSNYCITFSWKAALTFAWDSAQPSSDILTKGNCYIYISGSPF